jgi:hypothetical protein
MYDRKYAGAAPGQEGPLRFQEGVASDTDVPNEFTKGAMQGYVSAPGRPNRNANVYEKYPDETMRERAHVGSAAWIEAETMLGEFAASAFSDHGVNRYEEAIRSGARYQRINPTVVTD